MTNEVPSKPKEWPSIDDHKPNEEGGPTARSGLAYQDEIVVEIFLDMIEDPSIQKVHCETHDDIVVKRLVVDLETVEYIQVKPRAHHAARMRSHVPSRHRPVKPGDDIGEL
jgi:Cap4 dsDNA endonuclease